MSDDFERLSDRVALLETQERRIVELLETPDAFTRLMLRRRVPHAEEVRLHRLLDSITKRIRDGGRVDPAQVEQQITVEILGRYGSDYASVWFQETLAALAVRYTTLTDYLKATGRYPLLDDPETKLRRLTEALDK